YTPREGQGRDQRGEGGFGRPDRPYQPRRDDRSEGFRGEREGFAPRGDRGDRGGERFERSDRPSRPYTPREGQGRDSRSESGFGRPDRPYQPRRDDRSEGFRGEREGFAPRGDRDDRGGERFERSDRPSRPYALRDGQGRDQRGEGGFGRGDRPYQPRRDDRGDGPRGERSERRSEHRSEPRSYGDDRAPRQDNRSREDYRAERRAGPKPGEERSYGGIRTYRAPAELGGKAAPIKVTRPPEAAEPRADARPGESRINKRMAELGMCSRREADEWVENGWVKVNGSVAVMGQMVVPGDRIEIDRAAQDRQDQQVTILLHKPVGYVSGQAEDGHEPAVVLINPQTRWNHDHSKTHFNFSQLKGLAPCGRLDIDSVGLLVLTQDGRVARQIIGEDSTMDKEYLVRVTYQGREVDIQSVFPAEQLALLRHGLELDGEPLQPAQVDWQNPEQLRFVLTEGKKRQIRRMCEQVGLYVVGLKRIRIGKVVLGNLPVGQWRYLGADEQF
ncbi:MAG: pseudouridine synthase, partial [Acidovorax sp.]|nr:pseudouridine synthase [Acidovorax sp.]